MAPARQHLREPCEKTTVFLHAHLTARSPSQPAFLWFTILVQENNVREIRADMSKANRSQITWVRSDVCGLFSWNVRSFSDNVGLSVLIFSDNLGTKLRCSRAERFMLSRRYTYTPALPRARLRVKEWLHLIGPNRTTSDSARVWVEISARRENHQPCLQLRTVQLNMTFSKERQ